MKQLFALAAIALLSACTTSDSAYVAPADVTYRQPAVSTGTATTPYQSPAQKDQDKSMQGGGTR
jgi:uncharacterized lipoprotein YajG